MKLLIEDARKNEVIDNYDTLVYDLTQTSVETLLSDTVDSTTVISKYTPLLSSSNSNQLLEQQDESENSIPVTAEIASFSNDGIATIRFS